MPESNEVWNYVVSSNIEAWRYDSETQVLDIRFLGKGDVYSYDDVPADLIEQMRTAASVGKFFYQHIKNQFRYYRG